MRFSSAVVFFLLFSMYTAAVWTDEPSRSERLDQLFATLKQAPDEVSARSIEDQIWRLWMTTGNPEINGLMQQALEARGRSALEKALALLDQISAVDPAYAEAWNQRAIIHFQLGNYEQALVQVARTLELEPRHFGALAGRGIIRLRQGKSALAIQNIKAAMALHPYLRERYLVPDQ